DRWPDPHSPLVSWFWGHLGWLLVENRQLSRLDTYERYARDVLRDPLYLRLERGHLWVWVWAAHALLFYLAGLAAGLATTGSWQDWSPTWGRAGGPSRAGSKGQGPDGYQRKGIPMNRARQPGALALALLVPALLRGGDAEVRTLKAHQGSVMAVAFSSDGRV